MADVNQYIKLKLDGLNKVFNDLPFHKHQANRDEMAHFCEHDGICICFTQARSTWHALAPCALKPWWLFLKPSRLNPLRIKKKKKIKNAAQAAKITESIEVT